MDRRSEAYDYFYVEFKDNTPPFGENALNAHIFCNANQQLQLQ